MESFWDHSWAHVDTQRIAQYVHQFDMEEDVLISALREHQVRTVCDAGCGCGVYVLKLLAHGFEVSGFDISEHAVEVARKMQDSSTRKAELKTADIMASGYETDSFDAVISRDVMDHMSKGDARMAISELMRITKAGGIVLMTLDHLDSEYEMESHDVSDDGDYVFTDGKWKGMVFHPYTKEEIMEMLPPGTACEVEDTGSELVVRVIKCAARSA